MCEKSINGKSLNEIEAELAEEFDEADFVPNDSDGSKYIPIEKYEKRFNEIFGYMNYDKITTEAKVVEVLGSYNVQVTMKVTLYDDDGNPFITKSANGVRPIIVVKDTGSVKSYKSDVASAESVAFSKICQSGFGIGNAQTRLLSKYKKGGSGKSAGNGDVNIQLLTSFQDRTNRLTAKAVDSNGQSVEVVIFQKNYPEIEKQCPIRQFISEVTKGKFIAFNGRYNTYRDTLQLIFDSNLHAGKRFDLPQNDTWSGGYTG